MLKCRAATLKQLKNINNANFKALVLFPIFRAQASATKNFKALVLKKRVKGAKALFFLYTNSDIVIIPKKLYNTHVKKSQIFTVKKKLQSNFFLGWNVTRYL